MKKTVTSLALLALLAGCVDRTPAPAALPEGSDAAVPDEPVDHQPMYDLPPATAPTPAPATTTLPAEDSLGYDGFGDVSWSADEQAIHDAWGAGLEATPADFPDACRYLLPRTRTGDGYGMAFMLEGQRLVRIDIDSTRFVAPGGGRVGMTMDQIMQLHGDVVEVRNHKYVDGGRYLRVPDPAGGPAVLVFATGENGRVTEWRVGVPPQVDYVEGCS